MRHILQFLFPVLFFAAPVMAQTTEIAVGRHSAIYRFSFPEEAVKEKRAVLRVDLCSALASGREKKKGDACLGGNIQYDPRSRMLTGYGEYKRASGEIYRVSFAAFSDNVDLQRASVGASPAHDVDAPTPLFATIPVAVVKADLQIAFSLHGVDEAQRYLREETIGQGFGTLQKNGLPLWETMQRHCQNVSGSGAVSLEDLEERGLVGVASVLNFATLKDTKALNGDGLHFIAE